MSSGDILWIENDRAYVRPHVRVLESEGYRVTILSTVSEAMRALERTDYSLIILDVMIPTTEADEADGYSAELTDNGQKTGLAFYARNRDQLIARRTSVMVMTIRFDQSIANEFIAAGLPTESFVTKYSMLQPWVFLEKANSIIETGPAAKP